ncbi:DivIVA domain-containing protein [Spirillospora sp. NPDC048911]|uniref:DivIVA domain-containing protein n=1 Tax=Spirillospora sp. NPDC048911 TaxID=3364527 RepID=UPI00371E43E7
MSRLTEPFRLPPPHHPRDLDRRLTPEAVHDQRFSTTRLYPGYAMEEVDAFLDHVKQELARLIQERDEARSVAAERPAPQPAERPAP